MSNKKEDLDFIPAIKPASDEVASYQRTNRRAAPKQSNFNGMLVFSLVLMAIMLSFGGFQMFELQKNLERSNKLLETSQANINNLQNELAASTGKSTNTFRSMAAQQKTNVLEIDKLWKISHRENKPDIARIKNELIAIKKLNVGFDDGITSFKSNLVKVTGDFDQLSTDMAGMKQNLMDDNSDMVAKVSQFRGQIQDTSDVTENNRRTVAALNKKVVALEEAVDVFDRYRQQLNQQLLNLRNQINSGDEIQGATQN